MIVVRNVFQIEFGKAKPAIALWKEGLEIMGRVGQEKSSARILTDLVGVPFYTLILESTHESIADFEAHSKRLMADPAWQTWYAKVTPLSRGGHREILNVVG